jgi:hypothetical protein
MQPANQLHFAVSDRINGVDVGPKHIPPNLLVEFPKDVNDFLQGSSRDVDLAEVRFSIEEGSLALVATGLLGAFTLWTNVARLAQPDSLGAMDPRRAVVVERWQAQARGNPGRAYRLQDAARRPIATVSAQSDFKRLAAAWVTVEKYLHGRVVDWGGKTRPNVHLELEDGTTLVVAATQAQLGQERENRLYRPALLHVVAEENLGTGELRNLKLQAFEAHHPAYDEDEFQQLVRKGTAAWADVPHAAQWVESLRGEGV